MGEDVTGTADDKRENDDDGEDDEADTGDDKLEYNVLLDGSWGKESREPSRKERELDEDSQAAAEVTTDAAIVEEVEPTDDDEAIDDESG